MAAILEVNERPSKLEISTARDQLFKRQLDKAWMNLKYI